MKRVLATGLLTLTSSWLLVQLSPARAGIDPALCASAPLHSSCQGFVPDTAEQFKQACVDSKVGHLVAFCKDILPDLSKIEGRAYLCSIDDQNISRDSRLCKVYGSSGKEITFAVSYSTFNQYRDGSDGISRRLSIAKVKRVSSSYVGIGDGGSGIAGTALATLACGLICGIPTAIVAGSNSENLQQVFSLYLPDASRPAISLAAPKSSEGADALRDRLEAVYGLRVKSQEQTEADNQRIQVLKQELPANQRKLAELKSEQATAQELAKACRPTIALKCIRNSKRVDELARLVPETEELVNSQTRELTTLEGS